MGRNGGLDMRVPANLRSPRRRSQVRRRGTCPGLGRRRHGAGGLPETTAERRSGCLSHSAASAGVDGALISSPHVLRQSRVTVFGAVPRRRGRRPGPTPWAPLRRPLAECRLALVASSVCLAHDGWRSDPAVQVGDPSLRTVAGDLAGAAPTARSPGLSDPSAANLDRNLAFALERLREAVADGRLGELNRRHLALGGVMAAGSRAIRKRAPQAARWLTDDRVDVALLVPT